MAKKTKTALITNNTPTTKFELSPADRKMIFNGVFSERRRFLNKYMDIGKKDINAECDYPDKITIEQFKYAYDREGIATRIIDVYPEECWAVVPEVYDSEEPEETPFEKRKKELWDEFNLDHWLERLDKVSGIGRFGLALCGYDDNQPLKEPVQGINWYTGEPIFDPPEHKLTFIRLFDESMVTVKELDQNETSPRFGQPLSYELRMANPTTITDEQLKKMAKGASQNSYKTVEVHWTRVLHVADNAKSSPYLGTPRLENVYNRVYDLRKILSGSGEMFWKGAFPGLSLEVQPGVNGLAEATIDQDAMAEQMEQYQEGLQRYLAMIGVSVKSLAPQVASPREHFETQITAICIGIATPQRQFMGSEQSKVAGNQDTATWNKRLRRRQVNHVSAVILKPLIKMWVNIGVLPKPEELKIHWPDLAGPDNKEKADTALVLTQALAAYMMAKVEHVYPPLEFLSGILGIPLDVAQKVVDAAEKRIESEGTTAEYDAEAEAMGQAKAQAKFPKPVAAVPGGGAGRNKKPATKSPKPSRSKQKPKG